VRAVGIRELGDRSWSLLGRLAGVHATAYRASRGVIGHRFPGLPQMLLLDHVGAKSGRRRSTPLVYIRDGDDLVLVASKGGHPKHPAWFHNLKANPDAIVQVGSEIRPVRARLAEPQERDRLWAKADAEWSDFRTYRARAEREIPLVVLERRS
jgi:F420H(2)-dependent quinone reductase